MGVLTHLIAATLAEQVTKKGSGPEMDEDIFRIIISIAMVFVLIVDTFLGFNTGWDFMNISGVVLGAFFSLGPVFYTVEWLLDMDNKVIGYVLEILSAAMFLGGIFMLYFNIGVYYGYIPLIYGFIILCMTSAYLYDKFKRIS